RARDYKEMYMKNTVTVTLALVFLLALGAYAAPAKALVAYFSATGNTRQAAEAIAKAAGADIYEIVPETPYTEADLDHSAECRSMKEKNDPASRPKLGGAPFDFGKYEVVYVGFPIWYGLAPRIICTFVESCGLAGKTVIPFCTSGGGGIEAAEKELAALGKEGNWLPGKRFAANADRSEAEEWAKDMAEKTRHEDLAPDPIYDWDKTFDRDPRVNHSKTSFINRYGIILVADLYEPKNASGRLPALAVCGPFGAVKEQVSGRYAQEMAARGFVAIAFDPSYTGESGGYPRNVASPDINTEDFQAAVDWLSVQDNVDPERIGIIGICGWGGMALNAAALDTRVKATVTSTMYDMSRQIANGYNDADDSEEARHRQREALNKQRTEDFKKGSYGSAGPLPEPEDLDENTPQFVRDYAEYYKTPLGYHERSVASNQGWNDIGTMSFLNQPLLRYSNEIRSAVLMIHGEKAHSLYFSRDAFHNMINGSKYTGNKRLLIIPGAVHTDLYYKMDVIPFDKMEEFFRRYLK
ncbi:MAG: dienelactone hydrolase family protein, partial [Abditibacteriota bacterium]|nr:dienelactone hydrolase family protein [Abditibacteriota bacterium]